jgi:biopolymer transport protein ExbD
MRGKRRKSTDEEAAIDLTPMLDVVFIMLIFFIVTASFLKEAGVGVNRPEASNTPPDSESKNILINLTSSNQIWIENRRVDVRSIRAVIERMKAENPKAAVVLSADNGSKTSAVVAIMDASRDAGVYDVSLATPNL